MNQTTQPIVRWMKLDDMEQVAKISSMSKGYIKKFLREPKSICVVVVLEEKVVGIVFYEIRKQNINIKHIAVDEDFRKIKIATKLVNNLIFKLNSTRNTITAEVPEHNLCAQLFFRQMGFKAIDIIKNSEGDTYKFKYLFT